jgi:diguanylate cyclase (GGDEF)-like protein
METLVGTPFWLPVNPDEAVEVEISRGSEGHGVAELSIVETVWDSREAWLINLRDITERKRAEEQVMAQNALLEAINTVFESSLRCGSGREFAHACLAAALQLTGGSVGLIGELDAEGQLETLAVRDPRSPEFSNLEVEVAIAVQKALARGESGSATVSQMALSTDATGVSVVPARVPELLHVLIKLSDSTTGVLAVADKATPFDWADLLGLESLASVFAQALRNKRMEGELRRLSLTDPLTGLYNRRGFFLLAEQHVKLARRAGREVILVIADLDGLKEINDTLGHQAGDQALVDTADVLRTTFRESDIIARMGGDEFAILLNQGEGAPDTVTARLEDSIERLNTATGRPYTLSMSTGVASLDPNGESFSLDELVARADRALYGDKNRRAALA